MLVWVSCCHNASCFLLLCCREFKEVGGDLWTGSSIDQASIQRDVDGEMESEGVEAEAEESGMEVEEWESEDVDVVVKELEGVVKLTSDQVSMCQYRHMLLCYLNRLETYQVCVGHDCCMLHGKSTI